MNVENFMARRPYQKTALDEFMFASNRFWALLWERQAGKSTTLADFALHEMLMRPNRTVIYGSASLLLGQEITLKAAVRANQAVTQIIERDAAALKHFAETAQSTIDGRRAAEIPSPPCGRRIEGGISPKNSRIEPLNQPNHPTFQTIGEQCSLSQRERAGVRENRLNKNPLPIHGELRPPKLDAHRNPEPDARCFFPLPLGGEGLRVRGENEVRGKVIGRDKRTCGNSRPGSNLFWHQHEDTTDFLSFIQTVRNSNSSAQFKTFDTFTGREIIVGGASRASRCKQISAAGFAELFSKQRLEFRVYHDRGLYSRAKVIAPNVATARSWSGTVLLDEVAFIRNLRELIAALLPVISTDKQFKLILSTTPPEFDDTHYSFELLAPPAGMEFAPNPAGNWYVSESNVRVHRVDAFDTFLAGKKIFDLASGAEITPAQAFDRAPNKDAHRIAHWLTWMRGGAAACDLERLKTAQERGAGQCQNFFIHSDADLPPALNWLTDQLKIQNSKFKIGHLDGTGCQPVAAGNLPAAPASGGFAPPETSNSGGASVPASHFYLGSATVSVAASRVSRDANSSLLTPHSSPCIASPRLALGFDVATTTKGKANPSVVSVMEQRGLEWLVRARFIWKSTDPATANYRLDSILDAIERRGIRPIALAQDATNERYYAEANRKRLRKRLTVLLVVASQTVDKPGLDKPINWKEYLGNQLIAKLDDNLLTLPADNYTRADYRLVMKDRGKFVCEPNTDGMHGDCFDADKLAGHALTASAAGGRRTIVLSNPTHPPSHSPPPSRPRIL